MRTKKSILKQIKRFEYILTHQKMPVSEQVFYLNRISLLKWVLGKNNEWQSRLEMWKYDKKRLNNENT